MDKVQVSAILNEIGLLLELAGENPFKARAYYQAARTVEGLEEDLRRLIDEGRLGETPGLGPALRDKISLLVTTGRLPYYEDLRARVPPGLLEMLRLPGLGPRKVQVIHRTLGLTGLDELEEACQQHRLQDLPGFGAKTEFKILAGLDWLKQGRDLHLWAEAWPAAEDLRRQVAALEGVREVMIAGSLRRCKEVVKNIDLVASAEVPAAVGAAVVALPAVDRVIARGETRIAVSLRGGLDLDLRLVSPAEFTTTLHHLTGSKEHHTVLRGWAKDRGLTINEYGLFRGDERLVCTGEEEIYQHLDLQYIPPELREDLGEIGAAARGALPELVEAGQVRGALHNHTTASDGTATMREMADAAAALGWEYMGIADHSQSASYAGGLRPDGVRRQWEGIAGHNQTGRAPYLLAGIEAEILPDGGLDYPDAMLAGFDYVVASVHSHFTLSREAMTARIVRAMANPYVTVLGHPTGRLLLQRAGYEVDLDQILAAAARHDVALEINAHPYRLDLDWRWCHRAREMGIVFWVNPDAHSTGELAHVRHGINVARKGWLRPEQVGNTWGLVEVLRRWRGKRAGVPPP